MKNTTIFSLLLAGFLVPALLSAQNALEEQRGPGFTYQSLVGSARLP